jgi:tRNA_anti-like
VRPEISPIKIEKNTGTTPDVTIAKTEKADFTTTAEELDKEFTKKGVKNKDLEKYANKNIAVTGRVSTLALEKKGTTQSWVTLYAPGVLHGVSCYFDDDNLKQMKELKMDKTATVQGFQNDFIVPEVSPRLDHCVVIKTE